VTTRYEKITAADGGTFDAFGAVPAGGSWPGILLFEEIFGINDNIRSLAEQCFIFEGCEYSEGALSAASVVGPFDPGDDRDEEERYRAFERDDTAQHCEREAGESQGIEWTFPVGEP
jgi:dienelactone hydrolase